MAVAAPKIRDLQTLIKQQQAALQPQYGIIDESIKQGDTAGAAQEAGLGAKKVSAFGQIAQEAQNKGMSFSGFTPNEEALYTAGTYLPALAQLQATIANTRTTLLGKKAELGKTAFDTATNQQENDRQVLADWNKMTAQQQFDSSESAKQRVFSAHQNELDRAASAARSSAANAGISGSDQKKQDVAAAHGFLQGMVGSDNRVSPTTYAQGKSLWSALGYSGKDYDKNFAAYRNPNNKYYKLG